MSLLSRTAIFTYLPVCCHLLFSFSHLLESPSEWMTQACYQAISRASAPIKTTTETIKSETTVISNCQGQPLNASDVGCERFNFLSGCLDLDLLQPLTVCWQEPNQTHRMKPDKSSLDSSRDFQNVADRFPKQLSLSESGLEPRPAAARPGPARQSERQAKLPSSNADKSISGVWAPGSCSALLRGHLQERNLRVVKNVEIKGCGDNLQMQFLV